MIWAILCPVRSYPPIADFVHPQLYNPDMAQRCLFALFQEATMMSDDEEVSLEALGLPAFLQELDSVAVALLDDDGQILKVNHGFRRLVLSPEVVSQPWDARTLLISPRLEDVRALVPYESNTLLLYRGMLNIARADRQDRPMQGHIYRWPRGRLLVAAEYDVEGLEALGATVLRLNDELAEIQRQLLRSNREIKRDKAALKKQMYSGPLIEVNDWRRLEETLATEVERSRRRRHSLCLLVADLDHFGQINDRWGHATGNMLLRDFAALLREYSRQSDWVVRSGGGEFVVLLPETLLEPAVACAERIRQRLEEQPILLRCGSVTASFGVAMRVEGEGGADLLRRAEQALSRSKREGRNRVTQSIISGQNAAPNVSSC